MNNTNTSLDLVMPLILSQWGYFENFMRTYDRNWFIPGRFFVLARPEELTEMKSRMVIFPVHVLSKANLIGHRPNMLGPYRAMATKIAACEVVTSDNYMIIDADCLITRKLVDTSQLKWNGEHDGQWLRNAAATYRPHFYASAAEILGVNPIPKDLQATGLCPPAIYSREVSEEIVSRLRAKTGSSSNWAQPLDTMTPWGPNAPWAEVFLHDTMAYNMGLLHNFSYSGLTEDVIDAAKPWNEWRSEFQDWPGPRKQHPFSVVHSFTGIAPQEIWQKVNQ